ncbi:DUF445 family protein [Clostridium pasteurianum]|uniref:Putative membrane protein n=1 Tax=Clostridium pasteurianum BC1 TaxID=86416 RepID=R4K892_CLOPA|nr:DUF445 family protein [Clostridium pasteurianum]AGK96744.1 putative membrane protein [Clostridium pasteurianum BC1]
MDKKNKKLANLILLIFAVGFFISYAFEDYFVGALISRCCMAALIGGLADWFGITAIFKKPLNINWPKFLFRTDIINKNKDRIVDIIVGTVEKDLLNKEKIKNKLESYNLAGIIVRFIRSREGDEALIQAMDEIFDPKQKANKSISDFSYEFLSNTIEKINISQLLYRCLLWSSHRGYDDMLIDKIIDSAINLSKGKNVTVFIEKLYENALKTYEKNNINRKLTNKLILNYILDMSPNNAAYSIQKEIVKNLHDMKNYDNKNRKFIKEKLKEYALRLNNDASLIDKIENYKIEFLRENDFLKQTLEKFLDSYITENFYSNKDFIKKFKVKKRKLLLKLIRDRKKINSIDNTIKDTIYRIIDDKYNCIGTLIRENLNKYNNEEIVKIMEERLSEDLQIIRINGSIVGGLVGLFIFLLTFWIR